jgi:putative hydrolase of the HAD superfamily
MLKALIFDFDGLILDTETPGYDALEEVYAEFGLHLPIETYGLAVGSQYSHEYEPVADLRALTGKDLDPGSFWRRVDRRRMELIEQNPILPGVERMLKQGQARGMKLAVASSSDHLWVDAHLKRHSLFHLFDAILCKDDVDRIKPNPDLFLAALNALKVNAGEAVIFEDSLNGIVAANRAGVRVVAVPNPITRHLNLQGETLRLDSLADISLDDLLTKL